MRAVKKMFLLLGLVGCCISCKRWEDNENHHTTIKVTNLSDKPIYVGGAWVWAPDYTGSDSPQYSWIGPENLIACGVTNTEALRRRPKDSFEKVMSTYKAKYYIFFIDAERFDNWKKGDPRPDDLFEKRLYSLGDFRELNFHVTYP